MQTSWMGTQLYNLKWLELRGKSRQKSLKNKNKLSSQFFFHSFSDLSNVPPVPLTDTKTTKCDCALHKTSLWISLMHLCACTCKSDWAYFLMSHVPVLVLMWLRNCRRRKIARGRERGMDESVLTTPTLLFLCPLPSSTSSFFLHKDCAPG